MRHEIIELLETISDIELQGSDAKLGYYKSWLAMVIEDFPPAQTALQNRFRQATGMLWVSGENPVIGDSTPVNIEI